MRLANREISFEDAVLLLYLLAKLGGCRAYGAYTHVLVDEAQDLCPLQHKALRLLFPRSRFTVLADPNQGVLPAVNTGSAQDIADIYGAELLRMGKSYRSTRQISEYAKRYLSPEAADYEVFEREGSAPFEWTAENLAEKTAALIREAAQKYKTVCVLLKTAADLDRFSQQLKPFYPDAVSVRSEKKALSGSVLLMPAMLAKGLEFDCVLIPVDPASPPDDRLMYLFVTRALHEVHIIRKA